MLEIADEISWNNYLADQIWNSLSASSLKIRHRDNFNFRCPLCGDSKKNSNKKRGFYYLTTSMFHCFNCETSLNGISFLKRIAPDNVFHDAMIVYGNYKLLSLGKKPRQVNFSIKDKDDSFVKCKTIPAWKVLVDEYNWKFPTALTNEAIEYLKSRKVSDFSHFLSIENKKGTPFILILYKYFGDCIFYQVHNYTGTELPGWNGKKYIFPNSIDLNDQEKPVFNIDGIDSSWPYIICVEGVYDALSYMNGVALGGRTITDFQMKMLKSRWPHHELVFAFDNDKSGFDSMRKLSEQHGNWKFLDIGGIFQKVNVKDANDFVKLGERAVLALKSKSFLEQRICSGMELGVRFSLD